MRTARSLWRVPLCLAFLLAAGAPLAGQEAGHAEDDHGFHPNHIALFAGATTALNKEKGGTTSFTLGADYERRITPKVGVMGLVDFAIGDHKRTVILAAMFAWRPADALRIALGPGAEWVEKDEVGEGGETKTKRKAYYVTASRLSYDFHVGQLSISPTLGLDFIGETKASLVYGVSFGLGF